jgi:predicted Zn-ribbon and HTH transcriptional regulator
MSRRLDTSIADARKAAAEQERLQRIERARRKRALGSPPDGKHCASAYTNYGCRCPTCRTAWREGARRRRDTKPAPLALEVDRLNAELDAAEMNLDALREENTMLRCRLEELEP